MAFYGQSTVWKHHLWSQSGYWGEHKVQPMDRLMRRGWHIRIEWTFRGNPQKCPHTIIQIQWNYSHNTVLKSLSFNKLLTVGAELSNSTWESVLSGLVVFISSVVVASTSAVMRSSFFFLAADSSVGLNAPYRSKDSLASFICFLAYGISDSLMLPMTCLVISRAASSCKNRNKIVTLLCQESFVFKPLSVCPYLEDRKQSRIRPGRSWQIGTENTWRELYYFVVENPTLIYVFFRMACKLKKMMYNFDIPKLFSQPYCSRTELRSDNSLHDWKAREREKVR